MSRLRRSLSFENVLVTAMAFLVLAGGTAYAANQLGKNSVGSKQLKKNSVTAAKIKKDAVTTAKIKKDAVTATKVKDGSVEPADLNLASMPYGHVVFQTVGSQVMHLNGSLESPDFFPLENATFTQEAGSLDTAIGGVTVSIPSECEPPRVVIVFLLRDFTSAASTDEGNAVATGELIDVSSGAVSRRVTISPFTGGALVPTATATTHTLSIGALAGCKSGGGITLSNPLAQVIATR